MAVTLKQVFSTFYSKIFNPQTRLNVRQGGGNALEIAFWDKNNKPYGIFQAYDNINNTRQITIHADQNSDESDSLLGSYLSITSANSQTAPSQFELGIRKDTTTKRVLVGKFVEENDDNKTLNSNLIWNDHLIADDKGVVVWSNSFSTSTTNNVAGWFRDNRTGLTFVYGIAINHQWVVLPRTLNKYFFKTATLSFTKNSENSTRIPLPVGTMVFNGNNVANNSDGVIEGGGPIDRIYVKGEENDSDNKHKNWRFNYLIIGLS